MTKEGFKLPGSSYAALVKILRGYAQLGDKANLTELAKLVDMHKTVVSPNNPFLAQVGLVTAKRDKKATPLGLSLARALDYQREDEIAAGWQQLVKGSEPLANVISTVRIKGGMNSDDLTAHLLYVSGEKKTTRSRAGARAVVDILLKAGVLAEVDGKFTVAAPVAPSTTATAATEPEETKESESPAPTPPSRDQQAKAEPPGTLTPTIAINIELHLPETENSLVYENLFKALRKHLVEGKQ